MWHVAFYWLNKISIDNIHSQEIKKSQNEWNFERRSNVFDAIVVLTRCNLAFKICFLIRTLRQKVFLRERMFVLIFDTIADEQFDTMNKADCWPIRLWSRRGPVNWKKTWIFDFTFTRRRLVLMIFIIPSCISHQRLFRQRGVPITYHDDNNNNNAKV